MSAESQVFKDRIAELDAEIVIKNECLARYDDRVRALRKALLSCDINGFFSARVALNADDMAASELEELMRQ